MILLNNRNESKANATQTSNTATVKWSHWIGLENITLRSVTGGWFVPATTTGCIMRASWSASNFCAVCSAELTRRLSLVSGETFHGRHSTTMPNTPTVTIPSGANRIVPYAFHGNTSLQTLTIPSGVATIGQYAFLGATELTTITNQRTTPQTVNATTFSGVTRSNVTVNIPAGTTQAYINAGWTGFNLVEYSDVTVSGSFTSNNGTGTYSTGHTVNIRAGSNPGYIFNGWTVNSGNVSLANNTTTSFTMPSNAVSVTANWNHWGDAVYVDGSYADTTGEDAYAPNSLVTIHAGTREGFDFGGWIVDYGVVLADPSSPTTTFTMPSNVVSVIATWTPTADIFIELELDNPYSGDGGEGWFKFTPEVSGYYEFSLTGDTYGFWLALYDDSMNYIAESSGIGGCSLYVYLEADTTYYLEMDSTGHTYCELQVTFGQRKR